jgi:hypothetical protein
MYYVTVSNVHISTVAMEKQHCVVYTVDLHATVNNI